MLPARNKMNRSADSTPPVEPFSDPPYRSPRFKDAHSAHSVERDIHKSLLTTPGLKISSLVIHRIPGGFCVEGTIEVDQTKNDPRQLVTDSLKCLEGVDRVVNHLVMRSSITQAAPVETDATTPNLHMAN
ncbi:MAG: hypothetical protein CMJ46_10005 [Planctomyces sp.]|nr:hypothetical protein [Planctomyces sp.]